MGLRAELERLHLESIDRAYQLYTVLRDLYFLGKERQMSDSQIAHMIMNQFSEDDRRHNIKKLENAYHVVVRLRKYVLCHGGPYKGWVLESIIYNQKYLKRMRCLFKSLVYQGDLEKLKEEIDRNQKELDEVEKDFELLRNMSIPVEGPSMIHV